MHRGGAFGLLAVLFSPFVLGSFAAPVSAKPSRSAKPALQREQRPELGISLRLPNGFIGEELDSLTPAWRYHVYAPEMPDFDLTILPVDSDESPTILLQRASEQLTMQLAASGNAQCTAKAGYRRLAGKKISSVKFESIVDPSSATRFSVQILAFRINANTLSMTIVEPESITTAQARQVEALLASLRVHKRRPLSM